MKIAVLGAAGQLGRDLCPRLPGTVVPLTRAEIDLSHTESIAELLEQLRPQLFVNCAAYNLVDRAESEREQAFTVNAWGVQSLARACAQRGVKLVHFSTDHVFGLDQDRAEPLRECDPPRPVSIYGLSKLTGEYLVQAEAPDALIIRTCGLYGRWGSGGKGGNFVETMRRLAATGNPIRVVNDQHCTPSSTHAIAAATVSLLATGASGLFHITNSGSCTWFEFASEIFRLTQLKPNLIPITSAEFAAAARRPHFSVLSTAKLQSVGVASLIPWQEALAVYLHDAAQKPR